LGGVEPNSDFSILSSHVPNHGCGPGWAATAAAMRTAAMRIGAFREAFKPLPNTVRMPI
jgi:hypothetical protein